RLHDAMQVSDAEVDVRTDANRAWTFDEAMDFLRDAAGTGLAFVEEPLRAATPEQLARLAACSAVPLAVDESCRSLAELERMLRTDASGDLVLILSDCGSVESLPMIRSTTAASMPD